MRSMARIFCKLLRYLAIILGSSGLSPKEYQIATEVFAAARLRPTCRSMVRVQAGRLRTKLGEYYASEGVDDQIMVELPKGTYALTFHSRPHGAGRNHAGTLTRHQTIWRANGRTRVPGSSPLLRSPVVLASAVAVATDRF